MKYVITFLLAILLMMALAVGAVIYRDYFVNEDDAEEPAEVMDEIEDTDFFDAIRPVRDTRADFVNIAVSFSDAGNYELIANALMSDEGDIIEDITNGILNFAVTFDDANDNPFMYNIPVPDNVYNSDEAYNVATFVFSLDNNAVPSITFIPREIGSQDDNTHYVATYFVAIEDVRNNTNPFVFSIPVPDDRRVTSFAAAFIINFGDNFSGVNPFSSGSSAPAAPTSAQGSGGSTGGSISVSADPALTDALLGTWVYRAPGTHVELTFKNDWRYYEIEYAHTTGRPLSWESGVYSVNCGSTITIQSASIWGPTYTYNFSIRNNTLTFPFRGTNYLFTRQNRVPVLSLENFPYTYSLSGILHDPVRGLYVPEPPPAPPAQPPANPETP